MPLADEPSCQQLETAFDEIMVIAIAGINGDIGGGFLGKQRQRILGGSIVHAEHDDAFDVWPKLFWVGAARLRFRHPLHVAGRAGLQPLRKVKRARTGKLGPRHTAQIEAKLTCFGVQGRGKVVFLLILRKSAMSFLRIFG